MCWQICISDEGVKLWAWGSGLTNETHGHEDGNKKSEIWNKFEA